MEYRREANVSESETEEETVFPPINIGYAVLSPYCDISSTSTKVSLERSSFNEELVLESDPEDMEDECPCPTRDSYGSCSMSSIYGDLLF